MATFVVAAINLSVLKANPPLASQAEPPAPADSQPPPGRCLCWPRRSPVSSLRSAPTSLDGYDIVVVGAGNSACAYVSEILAARPDLRICMIERGSVPNPKYSDMGSWPNDTYDDDQGMIKPLPSSHNVRTASVVGGGGSVNYTMIHETDAWLEENLGKPRGFQTWAEAKEHVARWLGVTESPLREVSPNVRHLFDQLQSWTLDPPPDAGSVPTLCEDEEPRFRPVHTVFDAKGKRRFNGWNAVDWGRVTLLERIEVTELVMDASPDGAVCRGLKARDHATGTRLVRWDLPSNTRVILAAQQQSVRLLRSHSHLLPPTVQEHLGKGIQDHISLPIFVSQARPAEGRPDPYSPIFHHSPGDGFLNVYEWTFPEILRSLASWSTAYGTKTGDDAFQYLVPRGSDRHVFVLCMMIETGEYDKKGVLRFPPLDDSKKASVAKWREQCKEAETTWWSRWLLDKLDRFTSNTQFHTCGGCRKGEVVDDSYRVIGTANLAVIDTSTCPVPRTSSSMTAYLIGMLAARAHLETWSQDRRSSL